MHETLMSPSMPSLLAPDVLPAHLATIAVVAGSAVQSAANALSEMALFRCMFPGDEIIQAVNRVHGHGVPLP